jgi:hypothetical protein
MSPAPLIDYIDRRIALVDSISDALARRKANRARYSERSRKGAETRRVNEMGERL